MAEKSFKVKNSLVVKDVEIDPSGASTDQVLKYNGTKFVPAADAGGGGASVSDTPPSSPTSGQFWYESDTGKTFVYYDNFWVEVGSGSQGPAAASINLPTYSTGIYISENGLESEGVKSGLNDTTSTNDYCSTTSSIVSITRGHRP